MCGEYTCLACGGTFDTPRRWTERHGLAAPPYESWTGCPYCGGTYARTVLCDGCGEPITGDYVRIGVTGDCYCDRCFSLRSLAESI